jgi:hypothetical protein
MSPRDFQNARRVRRFTRAVFGAAARPHFALRQVEDASSISSICHLEQSSAASLFHVVAVRSQGENVDRHK